MEEEIDPFVVRLERKPKISSKGQGLKGARQRHARWIHLSVMRHFRQLSPTYFDWDTKYYHTPDIKKTFESISAIGFAFLRSTKAEGMADSILKAACDIRDADAAGERAVALNMVDAFIAGFDAGQAMQDPLLRYYRKELTHHAIKRLRQEYAIKIAKTNAHFAKMMHCKRIWEIVHAKVSGPDEADRSTAAFIGWSTRTVQRYRSDWVAYNAEDLSRAERMLAESNDSDAIQLKGSLEKLRTELANTPKKHFSDHFFKTLGDKISF